MKLTSIAKAMTTVHSRHGIRRNIIHTDIAQYYCRGKFRRSDNKFVPSNSYFRKHTRFPFLEVDCDQFLNIPSVMNEKSSGMVFSHRQQVHHCLQIFPLQRSQKLNLKSNYIHPFYKKITKEVLSHFLEIKFPKIQSLRYMQYEVN